MKCLVLDAMGVLFQSADDVSELLIPFIKERGGEAIEEVIQYAYIEASLGNITADEFWCKVRLSHECEDEYLSRHRLSDGVSELLATAQHRQIPVWCLSNDVGRWSIKLRENLGLENRLAGAIISGDVRARKPNHRIYEALISRSGFIASEMLFVDDREKNVLAAQCLGFNAFLFSPNSGFEQLIARVAAL
ncbi:MAG: HAD-IA family hydrolase [Pirellulaceae bacterium]